MAQQVEGGPLGREDRRQRPLDVGHGVARRQGVAVVRPPRDGDGGVDGPEGLVGGGPSGQHARGPGHDRPPALQVRWEELHGPTLARSMTAAALIVHDRDDPDVPYAHGEEIAAAWPGAELVTTRGLGHRAVLWDPEVIQRTVTFLSDGLTR